MHPIRKAAKNLYLVLLSLSITTGIVFAGSATSSSNQQLMTYAFQQINCKTTFTTGFISTVVGSIPNASSLNQQAGLLQQYTSQLRTYISSGNTTAFGSYVKNTYDPELAQISKLVPTYYRSANLSRNTTALLRSQYNSTRAAYLTCYAGALKNFSAGKVTVYQAQLTQAQNMANNLTSKGIDITSLTQLVQGANTQIIVPLQNALAQATNATQIEAALRQYCLFDGCQSGINYHLDARFQLQVHTLGLSKTQGSTNFTVNQTVISQVQSYLNAASAALNSIGTSPYTPTTAAQVWNNIKNASVLLQNGVRGSEAQSYAKKKLGQYIAALSNYQNNTNRLAATGIAVASLTQLLQNANSQIITPLQNAISQSGANATRLKNAFGRYCLFNGCINGTNYHLDVQFQIQVLGLRLSRVTTNRNVTINQTVLSQIQSYINAAQSIVNGVGTASYTQSQTAQIMNALKNATANSKFLIVRSRPQTQQPQNRSGTRTPIKPPGNQSVNANSVSK